MSKKEATQKIQSLAELREAALLTASRMIREFWESGANDMQTVKDNKLAYEKYRIRSRALINVSKVETNPSKPLFNQRFTVPIGIAPSSLQKLACPEGELATAAAARAKNWAMALSSYSTTRLDEVKSVGESSVVFMQLYVFKNRQTTLDLIEWAEKAGYKALLLTVDSPFVGRRYADVRNDFTVPDHLTLANFSKPGSKVKIGLGRRSVNPLESKDGVIEEGANILDPALTWEETIPWLRSVTKLEIWLKGITTAEDAQLALDYGIDGIWVSNHGGRQLDSTSSTLDALIEVVDVIKGRIPVHVDGGIRTGGDVFKALALGADFVWLGRPVLYGLQLDGQDGVERMIEIMEEDFRSVMALSGCTDVSQISKKCVMRVGAKLYRL